MFDKHSYMSEFFDNPNMPQKEKNCYLDENMLNTFIEDDCEYFERHFKNDDIKFIQFIPFKLKIKITKNNCFQYESNKKYNEQINNEEFDRKYSEKKCYDHMENCIDYIKTQKYETIKSCIL